MDPIAKFGEWLDAAKACKDIREPTAMCLATADAKGKPSARIVLLKHFDAKGFVFYTNLESRKSEELKANARAALCFYWMPLDRQVRIEGRVEPTGGAEADKYFLSRARDSRIGAWASKQSQPLPSRDLLEKAVADVAATFEGKEVTRPAFWSGWRIIPESIEFWQQGDFRLHDRELFLYTDGGWRFTHLYP